MNPLDTDISFVSLARPSAGRGFLSLYDHLESAPRPSKASINTDYSSGDNLRYEPSSDVTRRSLDLHELSRPDHMSNYIDSKRLSTSSWPVVRPLFIKYKHTEFFLLSLVKTNIHGRIRGDFGAAHRHHRGPLFMTSCC